MVGGAEHTDSTRCTLGVAVDPALDGEPDGEISDPDARVRTLVIRSREDVEMARQVRAVLSSA